MPKHLDQIIFGTNVQYHPITGQPLETGINAASPDRQAQIFCDLMELRGDKIGAAAMRQKIADAAKFAAAAAAIAADGVTSAAATAKVQ